MPRYEEVRSELKTGDVVLFSGKSAISNIIKLFSGGKWSHVGMIVRLEELGDGVFLWESTTLSDVNDIETGRATKGVQLVPLSQRIKGYSGDVTYRPLDKKVSAAMLKKLGDCRARLARKPYERGEAELFKAAYDGLGGKSSGEDLSSLFCSELVAEAYQSMGLLPEYPDGPPSNEYVPLDFSERREITLLGGFNLGGETSITT